MAEWKHGTHGTYVNGCRCGLCREASNAYKRELYHRNLSESRRKCRDKMRRYAKGRSVGNQDKNLIYVAELLDYYRTHSVGELRELIDQQARDDTYYMGKHPLVSFSLQEPLRGGYQF
jgi:hypothetical protein